MDAVVGVSQKTLAIDADHLLSNHFFLFPIESYLPSNRPWTQLVLKTFSDASVLFNVTGNLLHDCSFNFVNYINLLIFVINLEFINQLFSENFGSHVGVTEIPIKSVSENDKVIAFVRILQFYVKNYSNYFLFTKFRNVVRGHFEIGVLQLLRKSNYIFEIFTRLDLVDESVWIKHFK